MLLRPAKHFSNGPHEVTVHTVWATLFSIVYFNWFIFTFILFVPKYKIKWSKCTWTQFKPDWNNWTPPHFFRGKMKNNILVWKVILSEFIRFIQCVWCVVRFILTHLDRGSERWQNQPPGFYLWHSEQQNKCAMLLKKHFSLWHTDELKLTLCQCIYPSS